MKEFLKENKWKAVISSVAILLPFLVGLLLWNRLPENMTTHWGADSVADGFSRKGFAVFGPPVILLALHWIALALTVTDVGNKGQSKKAMGLLFWIMPILSWFCNGLMYCAALGTERNPTLLMPWLMALMFIAFGNYLPKIKQNMTYGIKVHWALYDEENWNMTHRFAGKLWVAGGILLLFASLLPSEAFVLVMLIDILVMGFVPVIYSYLYYRKQRKAGKAMLTGKQLPKSYANASKVGTVIGVCILIFVLAMMFTGNIDFHISDTDLTVEADYHDDLRIKFEDIDSIEFREAHDVGIRTYGFGSPRLTMGTFTNEEFGDYTRYAYTGEDSCVIIRSGNCVLLIGAKTDAETFELYQDLVRKIDG